jgi:subtilisin family serine protease
MLRKLFGRSGSCAFERAVIETLEQRCLLAETITAFGEEYEIVTMEWNGRQVRAAAGRWVVSLERPEPTRSADGEIKQFNERRSTAQEPNGQLASTFVSLASRGIAFDRYLGVEHSFSISAPTNMPFSEVHQALRDLPGFVSLSPDTVGRGGATPDDPDYFRQWGLRNVGQDYAPEGQGFVGTVDADIDANLAWDYSTGSSSVVVAVLDTGVNYFHQDLVANRWENLNDPAGDLTDNDGNNEVDDYYGYDFVNVDKTPLDDFGHGTVVAGVIAAAGDDGVGMTGVAWTTRILPVKVNDSNNDYLNTVLQAGIEYVNGLKDVGVNVRVVNLSLYGDPGSGVLSAIQGARDRGILVVAIAGNNGHPSDPEPDGWNIDASGQEIYPAAYTENNIISVAATDDDDNFFEDSNWGPTGVDLAAPGTFIRGPVHTSNTLYAYLSGTSFAAPFVSGVAALAFAMKPDLTYTQVREAILNNVNVLGSLDGLVATEGRLNANKTLEFIFNEYTDRHAYTFIGDHDGLKDIDDIWVRVKPGDATKVQVMEKVSGTYTLIKTLDNLAGEEIAIFALAGADIVTVDAGVANRVSVVGGMHADSIIGGDGNDTIRGETGNDTLKGGAGADVIEGQNGDDLIYGNSGADTLEGDGGQDTFWGGNGADSIFADDDEADTGSGEADTDVLDVDGFDTITQ